MHRLLNRTGLALAMLLTCIAATVSATSPTAAAPFNICEDIDCICPANAVHTSNPDVHVANYLTYCGTFFGVAKNGCCRADFPKIQCSEKQCIFSFRYCATATPGTTLAWVYRLPGQTTDQAVANGQYLIAGGATQVDADIRLNCGQGWIYEMWAYNPGLVPTTVMIDSFDFRCSNCPAG